MKIKPLRNYLLIEPIKVENVTPQGIYTPDSVAQADVNLVIGRVESCGPGLQLENGDFQITGIEPGDYVMFSAGTPVFPINCNALCKVDGSANLPNLVLIHFEQIMATVDTITGELLLEGVETQIC